MDKISGQLDFPALLGSLLPISPGTVVESVDSAHGVLIFHGATKWVPACTCGRAISAISLLIIHVAL